MVRGFAIFLVLLLIAFALLLMMGLTALKTLVNRIRQARRLSPEEAEELFRQQSNKHYKRQNLHDFDGDYFKSSKPSGSASWQSQSSQSRRTTTDEGVTVIDNRHESVSKRKIFNDDEGEYVEFTEE